jgi:uncharacterized protein
MAPAAYDWSMIASIWHILLELAPWLFLGAGIAATMHVLLPADFLRRQLRGRWGIVKAAAIGVPMPLCSCSVIPVGLSLRRQGASAGSTVAFLISTPETGLDSIFVSAGILGWPFAIFKLASAFVIGLTGGLLTDRFVAAPKTRDVVEPECEVPPERSLHGLIVHAIDLLRALWGCLVIGVLASAAIEYFMPAGGLERLGAGGGIWAMLLAVVVGMPLYVCSVASVPIAAALIHGGFPPGAALVFLIAGPATNVSTMGAVYRILGRRTLAIYLATIALGSMACGLAFDWVLAVAPNAVSGHVHHHEPAWWAVGSAVLLAALLVKFAWDDLVVLSRKQRAVRGGETAGSGAPRVEVGVRGMTCGNCVAKLERVIGGEAGVSGVTVTLDPGRAVVEGEISEPRVRELVAQAGFAAE